MHQSSTPRTVYQAWNVGEGDQEYNLAESFDNTKQTRYENWVHLLATMMKSLSNVIKSVGLLQF